MSVDEAERALKFNAIETIAGVARLDVGRTVRRGVPEIILAEGKSTDDLVSICSRMLDRNGRAVVSRVNQEQLKRLKDTFGQLRIE